MRTLDDLIAKIIEEIEKDFTITIKHREEEQEFCNTDVYSKKSLEKLHVHDLRSVARQKGVKAPTQKRKYVLVEEILAIQSGDKKVARKTSRGRPPLKK